MNRLSKFAFIATALLAVPVTAFADDEVPAGEVPTGETTTAPDPTAAPTTTGEASPDPGMAVPGLTLGKGKILIAGETVNINMSASAVGKPFSLAPSIYYGVSDKLTIGLSHDLGTQPSAPGVLPGAGICLSGTDSGCAKVYNNVGVDVLFGLAAAKFSAAVHGGLDFLSLDPMFLDLRVGLLGRYMVSDKIAITFDPRVEIGVTKRDAGNKGSLSLPVYLWFMASTKLGVYAGSGIGGRLDAFGDSYAIPLSVGATFKANEKLSVGGDFSFLNIGGKGHTADFRALGLRVAYAL
ncbi:hypothetical protein BH11MYX3_BH11MYX3_10950 [soil metagenome]